MLSPLKAPPKPMSHNDPAAQKKLLLESKEAGKGDDAPADAKGAAGNKKGAKGNKKGSFKRLDMSRPAAESGKETGETLGKRRVQEGDVQEADDAKKFEWSLNVLGGWEKRRKKLKNIWRPAEGVL